MAYLSSAGVVIAAVIGGVSAASINDIWSWFIMGLTAGALGPGILRLYWWRTNAWGMVAGLIAGGSAAVIQRIFYAGMPEWAQFLTMTTLSLVFTIVGSLATGQTPYSVVEHFYHTTRPFGFWGPFWQDLSPEQKRNWGKEHRNDILTVGITLVWQICLFLIPMQVLTHNGAGLLFTVPTFLICCAGLYQFWWKNLPPADEKIDDFVNQPVGKVPVLH
jgi:hypothetical protein